MEAKYYKDHLGHLHVRVTEKDVTAVVNNFEGGKGMCAVQVVKPEFDYFSMCTYLECSEGDFIAALNSVNIGMSEACGEVFKKMK